jgi:hypothetical protein
MPEAGFVAYSVHVHSVGKYVVYSMKRVCSVIYMWDGVAGA